MGPISKHSTSGRSNSSGGVKSRTLTTRQKAQQHQGSLRQLSAEKSAAVASAAATAACYGRQGSPRVFDVALEPHRRLATPRVVVANPAAGRRGPPATSSTSTEAAPPIARKSSDLKRIRDPELRALALVNSPMIDSRRLQQRRSTFAARSPPTQRQTESAAAAATAEEDADLAGVKAALETGDECEKVTRAYRMMLHQQWEYFRQLIGDWREVLATEAASIPEASQGSIRTAIGMAELLSVKKFPFFNRMLEGCVNSPSSGAENDAPDAALPILPSDVTGYWVLVEREIDQVKAKFASLEADRTAGWPVKLQAAVAPAPLAKRKQPKQPPKKTAGAAAAKSRFAEFRRKHLPASATGFSAISSPMVTFVTASKSGSGSARKSLATKTPRAKTPSHRASTARTPGTKTPAQNLHALKTPEVDKEESARAAKTSRPSNSRRTSTRVTVGAKTPTKETARTKTPVKEKATIGKDEVGTKTPAEGRTETKTPSKKTHGTKTPAKDGVDAKTPVREASELKTPSAAKTKTVGTDSARQSKSNTPATELSTSMVTRGASSIVKARIESYEAKISATKRATPSSSAKATVSEESPIAGAKQRRLASKSVSFNADCPTAGVGEFTEQRRRGQLTPYPDRQTRQSARRQQANAAVAAMETLEDE